MNEQVSLKCRQLVELITDYLDGTLSEPDRARVDAHLLGCRGCAGFLEQTRTTIRLTGRLTIESISPTAREELLQAYRRMMDSPAGM